MVNKVNKDAFKKLKKLSIEKRIEVANSPVGASMLALLTPSQFADLFPRYYQESLPDVGGFRAAISKRSQEKQQDILSGLAAGQGGSIDQAERAGRQMRQGSTGGGGGSYTPYKGGAYSPAQAAALARSVGATPEEAQFLGAVTKGESSGIPTKHNPNAQTGDDSYGLWQVNMIGAMGPKRMKQFGISRYEDLYDPKTNAKAALMILREQGRGAWGAYRDMQKRGEWESAYKSASAGAYGNVEMPQAAGATPSEAGGGGTSAGGNMVGKSFANAKGNTECATYAQQAGGVGHTSGWKPGQHASSGSLKPGDWVAAFHGDKYMNIRNREDPGNGSHVARFESYIYDNNGKIIGMNVTHQYNGSGGVIPGKFMFGSGGEFDASRYHQIVDRGSPASMSVSDGSDAKVQERQRFYKQNPQADDSDQVSKAEAQGQTADVKPAIQVAPPPPHPAASAPQTADLNETIKLHKEKYLNEVIKKHPAAEAPIVGPGRSGVWQQTIDGLKKSGVPFKETAEGIEVNISRKDQRYKDVLKDMRDNELDPKQFLDKIKYTPGGEQQTASTHSQEMRSKIEGYYGQKISDHEYNMLLRATHAESSAKRHVPQEHAMIMGTILNRAKKDGSIEKALMKNYQFESVTGRTKGRFSPNPAYKAGPGVERMGSMYKGVMDHLHNVSPDQRYFTSEKGDKSGWHAKMVKMGGDVHGGTRFGTKLGTEAPPEVKVAQAPPPPTGIPLDQTRSQEPGATTPKPTVEPPKPPSTMEKIGKELFPGGGAKAEAGVTVAKPEATTSTPSAPPTPTTTPAAAPTPVTPSATMPSEKVAGVTGAATGGAFDVGDGGIKAFPIDGLRGDNTLVVNKKEQPLFTMNSNEPAVYDPSKNRVDVIPKTNGNAMGPSVDGLRTEFDALRQELGNKLSDAGKVPTQQQAMPIQEIKNDMPSFINNLTNQNKTPYQNPAAQRAYARTRFGESTTRDPTNDYTFGNTNV